MLTAAIAIRAAQTGLRPVCLDGDRLGGGLDVTLGIEQERGVRWPDLAGARGRLDGPELLRRLPSVDGVGVLSFDRARDLPLVRRQSHVDGQARTRCSAIALAPARSVTPDPASRTIASIEGVSAANIS